MTNTLPDSPLQRVGVAVITAFVFVVPLVLDADADWAFTIPKALVTHAFAYLLAAVLVAHVIRTGRRAIPWSPLHIPVIAFLAVSAAASAFAEDRYLAVFGTHARMIGLATIVSWTVLYFAVTAFVRTRPEVLMIVGAALAGSVAMLVYEGMQLARLDPVHWSSDTATRPISTIGQATTLGAYLSTLAVGIIAITLVTGPTRNPRRSLGLVALAALLLVGSALTGTRSSLVGLAASAAVLVALLAAHDASRARLRLIMVSAGVATVAFVILIAFTPLGGRLFVQSAAGATDPGIGELDVASLDVRAVLYNVALDAVRERPLLGYGPYNFIIAMEHHRPESGNTEARLSYATSAHGWVSQTAADEGLLGLAAFLAIIATAAILVIRARSKPAAIVAGVMLTAYLGTGLTTIGDVGVDWLFWTAMGFVAVSAVPGLITNDVVAPLGNGRAGRYRRWSMSPVDLVCIGAAVLLATTAMGPWSASRSAFASTNARLVAHSADAIRRALDATSADPGRAEYWHDLGLAYIGALRWRDASVALERALVAARWDARIMSDLMKSDLVLAQGGDQTARARARALADEVVRVDPNHPDVQISRATVLQGLGGDDEAALRAVERALQLYPASRIESWYVLETQLYVSVGRPADAVAAAQRALDLIGPTTPLRLELARALLANGRPQDALTQVDAVLASDPSNADANQLRALLQSVLRR